MGDGTPLGQLEGTPYLLVHRLGTGAMGEVFLAVHEDLGKKVVVKILHQHLGARSDLADRLRREARLLAQIRHPNLVDIYDLRVMKDGRPFFVMEFVEGATVRDLLRARGGRLSVVDACTLMAQTLEGLAVAHERGIVHRDIKPENILVTPDGTIKLLDFGIAKVLEGGELTVPDQTMDGHILGTPRYMSPEQAWGMELSPQSDLYSIGCVLFELLTGRTPFDGTSSRELFRRHASDSVPMLAAAGLDAPAALDGVLQRALQKESTDRPSSARAMAVDLRMILTDLRASFGPYPDPALVAPFDSRAFALAMEPTSLAGSTTTGGLETPLVGTGGGRTAPTEALSGEGPPASSGVPGDVASLRASAMASRARGQIPDYPVQGPMVLRETPPRPPATVHTSAERAGRRPRALVVTAVIGVFAIVGGVGASIALTRATSAQRDEKDPVDERPAPPSRAGATESAASSARPADAGPSASSSASRFPAPPPVTMRATPTRPSASKLPPEDDDRR